ncbi:MAG: type II toxin-antitoxin system VapC family toxin [Thermoanaerobaculia bacterium]
MIVVDASVVADLLLRSPRASAIEAELFAPRSGSLHAPSLLDVEVLHVLRRFHFEGELSAARGEEAVRDLQDLRIERHHQELLVPRIWDLPRSLTVYDACYVALAELLEAPLLTLDRRLGRSRGHRAEVRVL